MSCSPFLISVFKEQIWTSAACTVKKMYSMIINCIYVCIKHAFETSCAAKTDPSTFANSYLWKTPLIAVHYYAILEHITVNVPNRSNYFSHITPILGRYRTDFSFLIHIYMRLVHSLWDIVIHSCGRFFRPPFRSEITILERFFFHNWWRKPFIL